MGFEHIEKMMKKVVFILGIIWFLIVAIPSSILMFKLSKYLIDTNFHEWWITIIWALITLPTASLIFLMGIANRRGER